MILEIKNTVVFLHILYLLHYQMNNKYWFLYCFGYLEGLDHFAPFKILILEEIKLDLNKNKTIKHRQTDRQKKGQINVNGLEERREKWKERKKEQVCSSTESEVRQRSCFFCNSYDDIISYQLEFKWNFNVSTYCKFHNLINNTMNKIHVYSIILWAALL